MVSFPANTKVPGVSVGLTSDLNSTYGLLQSILGSFVLPSGDTTGATDTPLLQAAATAGYLRLVPGAAYYVNQILEFPGNAVIEGGGANEFSPARLWMAAGANLNAVMASAGWNGNTNTTSQAPVTIRNLQIEANSSNQTGGNGHGLVLMNYGSRIENVTVKNTRGDGIRLDFFCQNGTTQISNTAVEDRITGCKIISAGAVGIHSTDPAATSSFTDGFIERCIVSGAGTSAIDIEASAGWLIRGNHIYGMQQHGIVANRPFNTRIIHNYVETWGGSGTLSTYRGILALGFQFQEGAIIADNHLMITAAPGNSGSTLRAIETQTPASTTAAMTISGNHMYCNQSAGAAAYNGLYIQNLAASSVTNSVSTGNNIVGTWTATKTLVPNGGTLNNTAGV